MKYLCILLIIPILISSCRQEDERFERAMNAAQNGDYSSADSLFTLLIKDEPDNDALLNNRAFVRLHLNMDSLALEDAHSAIQYRPDENVYYEVRAAIYLDLGDTAAAAADIQHALSIAPQSAQAYFLKGTLRQAEHRYADAIKALKKSIQLDPKQIEPRIQLIAVYANSGQNEKAIYEASKLLDQGILDPILLLNRGYATMNLQRYDLAAGDFEKALQLNPDLAEARNNLGWVRFMQGDRSEALNLINESLRLNKGNALAYAFKAYIFKASGEMDSACSNFRKAEARGFHPADHESLPLNDLLTLDCKNNNE